MKERGGHERQAARLFLAAEVLREFGELRLAALGSSMVPSVFPGDVLTVRRIGLGEVRCGDIILCARGDRLYAHRVARKEMGSGCLQFITRGDALPECDPPAGDNELLGRVSQMVRGIRQIVPSRSLTFPSRVVRWCLRRSDLLLKFFLGFHVLRERLEAEQPRGERAMRNSGGSW